MKIIFLDIDGVLNTPCTSEHCGGYIGIDDEKVKLLKLIVSSTDSLIILVSTWSENWYTQKVDKIKQDDLANYLDDKFKKFDITINSSLKTSKRIFRGEKVLERIDALTRNGVKVDSFVIIDDAKLEYNVETLKDNLVITDASVGLTKELAFKAIGILNKIL